MVTSVMRAHQILLARVHDALKPSGLTFAQYEALMLLSFSRTGKLPLNKIGQRLQVHPTSVTNVIDRLESKRLVERIPHPKDQRTTLAGITRKGRNVAAKATAAVNDEVFTATGFDEAQLHELTSLITTMRVQAGDFLSG